MPNQPATEPNVAADSQPVPAGTGALGVPANGEGTGRRGSGSEPDISDEVLMEALLAGDDSALGPLMARWELPLKGFLRHIGVPLADVEDIAQESFVRLYQKRSSYRSGARFKPWLLTIAANLGRNRLRWRLRRREESLEWSADLISAGTGATAADAVQTQLQALSVASPREQADRNSLYRALRDAIARLPDKLRRAVVCVELESLSHAEAAAVLGCTAKAIENRLHRARSILRERCASLMADSSL